MSSRLCRRIAKQGGLDILEGNGTLSVSPFPQPANTQAADANSTLTAAQILAGLYVRAGMTAGRTDTTDTGANIDTALTGANSGAVPDLAVGESITLVISNQVAFALTLAGGVGVTIASTKTTIPASGGANVVFTKTGVATYNAFIL